MACTTQHGLCHLSIRGSVEGRGEKEGEGFLSLAFGVDRLAQSNHQYF